MSMSGQLFVESEADFQNKNDETAEKKWEKLKLYIKDAKKGFVSEFNKHESIADLNHEQQQIIFHAFYTWLQLVDTAKTSILEDRDEAKILLETNENSRNAKDNWERALQIRLLLKPRQQYVNAEIQVLDFYNKCINDQFKVAIFNAKVNFQKLNPNLIKIKSTPTKTKDEINFAYNNWVDLLFLSQEHTEKLFIYAPLIINQFDKTHIEFLNKEKTDSEFYLYQTQPKTKSFIFNLFNFNKKDHLKESKPDEFEMIRINNKI